MRNSDIVSKHPRVWLGSFQESLVDLRQGMPESEHEFGGWGWAGPSVIGANYLKSREEKGHMRTWRVSFNMVRTYRFQAGVFLLLLCMSKNLLAHLPPVLVYPVAFVRFAHDHKSE